MEFDTTLETGLACMRNVFYATNVSIRGYTRYESHWKRIASKRKEIFLSTLRTVDSRSLYLTIYLLRLPVAAEYLNVPSDMDTMLLSRLRSGTITNVLFFNCELPSVPKEMPNSDTSHLDIQPHPNMTKDVPCNAGSPPACPRKAPRPRQG